MTLGFQRGVRGGAVPLAVLAALSLGLAAILSAGCGPEGRASPRPIGVLSGIEVFDDAVLGFQEALAELGYVEGEDVEYLVRQSEGQETELRASARELVERGVSLIATTTNRASRIAQEEAAAARIPVVMMVVAAPVEDGLVVDLRLPGGLATGVHNRADHHRAKALELMLEMVPSVRRVWVPYDPEYAAVTALAAEALRRTAARRGILLVEEVVITLDDLLVAVERRSAAADPGVDAVLVMPDVTVQDISGFRAILALAERHGLVVCGQVARHAAEGALFSYGQVPREAGAAAALMAHKILRGVSPAVIPMGSAEPRLFVNLRTAERLGIVFPRELLAQATEVFR